MIIIICKNLHFKFIEYVTYEFYNIDHRYYLFKSIFLFIILTNAIFNSW